MEISKKTMRITSSLLFLCFWYSSSFSQVQMDSLNELNAPLIECSGLIEIDGHFITHNDSGDSPNLYEINTLTGTVARQVNIANAEHIDWEDICHDDEYIYISDTGNNNGTRTNLKIYKVSINDYFNTQNGSIEAEVIQLAYADQTDFSGNQTNHNFDAEALISIGDSLYIFTKNRGDFQSNIYPVSKQAGNYMITKIDLINSQGLITGATYVPDSSKVVLTGYTPSNAFVLELNNLQSNQFSESNLQRHEISMDGSFQIESIAWKGGLDYLVATEGNGFGGPVLYCLSLDIHSSIEAHINTPPIKFFPNPAYDQLYIDTPLAVEINIYDNSGKLILVSFEKKIDISRLTNGSYWLMIKDGKGQVKNSSPLIISHP